jgi:hypothetical protein
MRPLAVQADALVAWRHFRGRSYAPALTISTAGIGGRLDVGIPGTLASKSASLTSAFVEAESRPAVAFLVSRVRDNTLLAGKRHCEGAQVVWCASGSDQEEG